MSQDRFKDLAYSASSIYRDFEIKFSSAVKEAVQITPSEKENILKMAEEISKIVENDGTSLSVLVSYSKFEKKYLPYLSDTGRESFFESRKSATAFGRIKKELREVFDSLDPEDAKKMQNEFSSNGEIFPEQPSASSFDEPIENGYFTDEEPLNDEHEHTEDTIGIYKATVLFEVSPSASYDLTKSQMIEEFMSASSEEEVSSKILDIMLQKMGISVEVRKVELCSQS